ncbi:MAG: hypothetical protein WKF76_03020 [Nocardioidaceae bacterium]|jgi:uncharacterized membrane protein YkoI
MNKKIALAAVAAGLSVSVAGGGAAIASSQSDDGDATVSGAGADKATAAALKATDGGTANSVERDSENGATWEVEVTRKDGSTVDVRLDEHYDLVVIEGDSAG